MKKHEIEDNYRKLKQLESIKSVRMYADIYDTEDLGLHFMNHGFEVSYHPSRVRLIEALNQFLEDEVKLLMTELDMTPDDLKRVKHDRSK